MKKNDDFLFMDLVNEYYKLHKKLPEVGHGMNSTQLVFTEEFNTPFVNLTDAEFLIYQNSISTYGKS